MLTPDNEWYMIFDQKHRAWRSVGQISKPISDNNPKARAPQRTLDETRGMLFYTWVVDPIKEMNMSNN